jgi:hypothetical protein
MVMYNFQRDPITQIQRQLHGQQKDTENKQQNSKIYVDMVSLSFQKQALTEGQAIQTL